MLRVVELPRVATLGSHAQAPRLPRRLLPPRPIHLLFRCTQPQAVAAKEYCHLVSGLGVFEKLYGRIPSSIKRRVIIDRNSYVTECNCLFALVVLDAIHRCARAAFPARTKLPAIASPMARARSGSFL